MTNNTPVMSASVLHTYERGVVGRVWLNEQGKAQMDEGAHRSLMPDFFVWNEELGRVVTPDDGEAYISALPNSWRGTYIWVEIEDSGA